VAEAVQVADDPRQRSGDDRRPDGGCACVLVTSTSIPTTSSYNFMVTVTITPAVHRHGDRTGRTAGQAGYFNRQNRAPTAAAFGI
jgi:hypothetical protein